MSDKLLAQVNTHSPCSSKVRALVEQTQISIHSTQTKEVASFEASVDTLV
jgi:hypothetical protein